VSRRVVITGIGLLSPVAIGTEANWQALVAGRSGVARITKFDPTAFPVQIAAEVKGFDPLQFVEKKDVKKLDVFIQYAIAASQFAMDDSGLTIGPGNATRVGVFIASGIGGFATIEREHSKLLEGGPGRISPFFIPAARFGPFAPNRIDTWPRATCRSDSARRGRTSRPAPRARPPRTRSATPAR
jgi:3-oxoacyl-[acyl-carrier-protein] synthase II